VLAEPQPLRFDIDRRGWPDCECRRIPESYYQLAGWLTAVSSRGLQFQEAWVSLGIEGGKKAAYALRAEVAKQCGDHADSVEIVAKVCCNLSGLGKAMRRHGCLDSEITLKDFTLGFTQAMAQFDFVDVGHGKERADSKIKGQSSATGKGLEF